MGKGSESKYVYIYNRITILHTWNEQNNENQLYSNNTDQKKIDFAQWEECGGI